MCGASCGDAISGSIWWKVQKMASGGLAFFISTIITFLITSMGMNYNYKILALIFTSGVFFLIGLVDDIAVIVACLKLVGSDIEEYEKWRKENNKLMDV